MIFKSLSNNGYFLYWGYFRIILLITSGCANVYDKGKKGDFSWVMSHPFNMIGKLPVLSVPSGLSSSNVPTGIQIIARSYSDELVFQGGYNYEMLDPWVNSNKNRPSIDL